MTDFTPIKEATAAVEQASAVEIDNLQTTIRTQAAAMVAHMKEPAPAGHEVVTTPPIPVPVNKQRFGSSYGGADESKNKGRADVARLFFNGSTLPDIKTNAYFKQAWADGIRTFVVSWKTESDAEVQKFLASFPKETERVYACFNHEVEDDIEKGNQTLLNYRNITARHAKIIKAAGFVPTQIFMQYTLVTTKRNIKDYTRVPGIECILWDAYFNPAKGKDNPAGAVDRMVQAAKDAGALESGLGETGVPNTVDPKVAESLVTKLRAKLDATPYMTVNCYWPSGEFAFPNDAVADAWYTDPTPNGFAPVLDKSAA